LVPSQSKAHSGINSLDVDDADLAVVISHWVSLSPSIKAAVVAVVRAAIETRDRRSKHTSFQIKK
jgi:hypothetical protein